MSGIREFEDGKGHVLGQIHEDGRGLKELWVYQNAVDHTQAGGGDLPEVIVCTDSASKVKCTICGEVRAWIPGEAELERIIQRKRRHQAGQNLNKCSIIRAEVPV